MIRLLLLFLASLCALQSAPLTAVLVVPDLVSTPGLAVNFDAAMTNNLPGDLYLNGVSTLSSSVLLVDETPFYLNTPLFLTDGESWTGTLFSVFLQPYAPPGVHAGLFSILGGETPSSTDVLAELPFSVTSVPEPATVEFTLAGLSICWLIRNRPKLRPH